MNADGTTAGYDLEMTAAVSVAVKIPRRRQRSGARLAQHVLDIADDGAYADAALAASIFHFGTANHRAGQVKEFWRNFVYQCSESCERENDRTKW